MDKQPLVSIIIPTYNRADLISETLDSIIAQTYQNWECIVVDDGSTDNTAEILKYYTLKDNRISYHHRPKKYKPGGNGARNYGFDISKGEYINWFDSDDVMLSDFISERINVAEDYDLIISGHYMTNEILTIEGIKNVIISESILKDYLDWKINFQIVTNNILFFRNNIDLKKYRFNENILRGQEAEFLFRIFNDNLENLKYIILNKPLFYYRQHNNSKTSDFKRNENKFNFSIIDVHFLKLVIAIKREYFDTKKNVIYFLDCFAFEVYKQRDLKSYFRIIYNLFNIRTFNSISLAIILIIMYPFKKYPKLLSKIWLRI